MYLSEKACDKRLQLPPPTAAAAAAAAAATISGLMIKFVNKVLSLPLSLSVTFSLSLSLDRFLAQITASSGSSKKC